VVAVGSMMEQMEIFKDTVPTLPRNKKEIVARQNDEMGDGTVADGIAWRPSQKFRLISESCWIFGEFMDVASCGWKLLDPPRIDTIVIK
jgi:hypothetical protein